jgi:hypothetical protein
VKTSKTITTTLTAVTLLAATTVLAAEKGRHATTQQLRDAKERIVARASSEKGYPRARLDMERVRLGNLIDDLESGKHVSPSDIDQALERANQPGF